MTNGVIASLNELISLRRFAQSVQFQTNVQAQRSGSHLSKIRGRGMDFSEVRNYQAGDEIRHMEWRVTARTGRPHVKIYQEERERPVVILADFNPSMIFGTQIAFKSVVAARLASILSWTVIKQGDRIGGFIYSATQHSELNPRGRAAGVLPLLATLSLYTDQTQAEREATPRLLSDALIRMRRVIRPGSILVLISDFYSMDKECEKHLNRLSAHNSILAYHICDPLELAPPKPEHYAMSNGQQAIIVDTTNPSIRSAYTQYCVQRVEQLKEQCTRVRAQYVQVTAQMDLPQLVRQTFPRRIYG